MAQLGSTKVYGDLQVTGEIGINTTYVSETELGILEGATLSTVELNYVDGVTSNIQTQLNAINSYPSADETKVGFITITQAVNLDTLESDVATNNAKVSNATHTGEVTGSTALTIANNVVDEANLKISNAPTNDYVLTADSAVTGGMKWAEASGGVTGDGVSKITVGATTPTSPSSGDLWVDTN